MDLLEMPLEALVLSLHSFPAAAAAAGSLWACLAVLAAALGLWRIHAVGFRSSIPPPKHGPAEPAQAPGPAPAPAPAPAPQQCHVEDVGMPKARFTVYYDSCDRFEVEDDGDDEAKVDGGREVDGVGDGRAPLTVPWEGFGWPGWEPFMIRRRGDLGWYRYQDLTVLNGSVVRLWDGDRVLTATSPRTSRRTSPTRF